MKALRTICLILTLIICGYIGIKVDKRKVNKYIETEESPPRGKINQDSLDWQDFTRALIWVESRGNNQAVSSKGAVGVLQIMPIIVEDCNRIIGYEKYTLNNRLDSLKSVEMFNVIQDHYNPQHDYHWALKLWNARSAPSYHRAVMDKFNEIKNNL